MAASGSAARQDPAAAEAARGDFADSAYWDGADRPQRGPRWRLLSLRMQRLAREAALLSAIVGLGLLLELALVQLPALDRHFSSGAALLLSLTVYALLRRHLAQQVARMHSAERMFEGLHRSARELEAEPERLPEIVQRLLCEMFEPAQALQLAHRLHGARVLGDGSALAVPLPSLQPRGMPPRLAVVLRQAGKGRRAFTAADARLAEQALDQLQRAVAHRLAVEQGRHEERLRMAQDLHDDIGARLLTLMYRASDARTEDYVRHTLADLKTITRGLSAGSHRLSDAVPEWRADIRQRLDAAGCALEWHFEADGDVDLGMAQWSALTRVLRELVSNAIAHAQASRVEVRLRYADGGLELSVRDDGRGGEPQAWSHGLGLAGVRKRVKLLGGQVQWERCEPCGIRCRVVVPRLEGEAS